MKEFQRIHIKGKIVCHFYNTIVIPFVSNGSSKSTLLGQTRKSSRRSAPSRFWCNLLREEGARCLFCYKNQLLQYDPVYGLFTQIVSECEPQWRRQTPVRNAESHVTTTTMTVVSSWIHTDWLHLILQLAPHFEVETVTSRSIYKWVQEQFSQGAILHHWTMWCLEKL